MKSLLLFALTFFAANALAYTDHTYNCKNPWAGYPDNVYKIKNIQLGDGAATLPYLELTRYLPTVYADQTSPARQIINKGIATVIAVGTTETFYLNNLRLEFINGVLTGCK